VWGYCSQLKQYRRSGPERAALEWRDVDIRTRLAGATGLTVHVENSGRASALAQLWLTRGETSGGHNFVYISVSDGVGVGVVVNGELLRGRDHIAGEFGHSR